MRRPAGQRQVTLLTGERGAGKSTVCLRVAEMARAAGLPVAGVASAYADLQRGRLEAVDLSTSQRWPLASAVESLGGPAIGRFSFSPAGLARALDALQRAAGLDVALLVVDEVGPLELGRREGFYPLLERLRRLDSPDLLVVVRPSLLGELRAFLAGERQSVLEVTASTRESLPGRILESAAARQEI